MKSSAKSHPFFNRLSYSLGNEDWLTEIDALQLKAEDEVLCITASGDRPLHLLLHPCKKLVAIDANAVQNHLLSLKMTALKNLSYDDYAAFLGLKEHTQRLNLFDKLYPYLPNDCARYWLKNKKVLKKGVIYEGATEQWAKRGAFLLRLFRGQEINGLFKCNTLNEQKDFLENTWCHALWKKALNFFLNPNLSKLFFKDPGTYNHEIHIKPGNYIYDRMIQHLHSNLAKDNFFMQLIFLGKITHEIAPPYLQEIDSGIIKENLSKIQIETRDLIEFLEACPPHSFNKFSFSDVASYMDYNLYVRLLKAMVHAAKPNSRYCIRQFMSRYQIPTHISHSFAPEMHLEKKLERKDRAFVYHFTVGTIIK